MREGGQCVESPTAPTSETELQTFNTCYQPAHIQTNRSNKALHYAAFETRGMRATVINTTEQCEQTERENISSGHSLDQGLQTRSLRFPYHTNQVNNLMAVFLVYLFTRARRQHFLVFSPCIFFFFYIGLWYGLRRPPLSKGSADPYHPCKRPTN